MGLTDEGRTETCLNIKVAGQMIWVIFFGLGFASSTFVKNNFLEVEVSIFSWLGFDSSTFGKNNFLEVEVSTEQKVSKLLVFWSTFYV